MALDELYTRRLATLGNLVDSALDRMELVLRSAEATSPSAGASPPSTEQVRFIRNTMKAVRSRLRDSLQYFAIRRHKPDPKQMLVAELSTLWVILENARPERMAGYGRELAHEDKAEWESLVQFLIEQTEAIRGAVLKGKEDAIPRA